MSVNIGLVNDVMSTVAAYVHGKNPPPKPKQQPEKPIVKPADGRNIEPVDRPRKRRLPLGSTNGISGHVAVGMSVADFNQNTSLSNNNIFSPQYFMPSIFKPMSVVYADHGDGSKGKILVEVEAQGDRVIMYVPGGKSFGNTNRADFEKTWGKVPDSGRIQIDMSKKGNSGKEPSTSSLYSSSLGDRGILEILPSAGNAAQSLIFAQQYYFTPSVFKIGPMMVELEADGDDYIQIPNGNGGKVWVSEKDLLDHAEGRREDLPTYSEKPTKAGKGKLIEVANMAIANWLFAQQYYYTPSVFGTEPMMIVKTNEGDAKSDEQPISVYDDGDGIVIRDEFEGSEVRIPKNRIHNLFGDLLKPEYSGGPGDRGMSVILPDADRAPQPLTFGSQYFTPSIFTEPMRIVEAKGAGDGKGKEVTIREEGNEVVFVDTDGKELSRVTKEAWEAIKRHLKTGSIFGARGDLAMLPDADRVLFGSQYYTPSVFRSEPMMTVGTNDKGDIVIEIAVGGRDPYWVTLPELESHAKGKGPIREYDEFPDGGNGEESVSRQAVTNADYDIVDVLLEGCHMAGVNMDVETSEMSIDSASEGWRTKEGPLQSGVNYLVMPGDRVGSPVMLSVPTIVFTVQAPAIPAFAY